MQDRGFDGRGGQGNNQQIYYMQEQQPTDLEAMNYGGQPMMGRGGKDGAASSKTRGMTYEPNQQIIAEDDQYIDRSRKMNKQGQAMNPQKYSQKKINEQQENEATVAGTKGSRSQKTSKSVFQNQYQQRQGAYGNDPGMNEVQNPMGMSHPQQNYREPMMQDKRYMQGQGSKG